MIGPKSIFLQSLDCYQNLTDDEAPIVDDCSSAYLKSQPSLLTQSNRGIKPEKKKQMKGKAVKFNLNTVHCCFSNKEPAIIISKQVKKLILHNPTLNWVNPTYCIDSSG